MGLRRCCLGLVLGAVFGFAWPVAAQITEEPAQPLPDPSRFARGWFADFELGGLTFLGAAHHPLGVGVEAGARVGYDFLRIVAFQLHAAGSSHKTDFDGGPQSGQLLQVYLATAEAKLSLPLGRVSVFALGGVGIAQLSTNLLGTTALTKPDARTSFAWDAGGGLDYHPLSRHFSFGLASTFAKYAAVKTTGSLNTAAYLRYTF